MSEATFRIPRFEAHADVPRPGISWGRNIAHEIRGPDDRKDTLTWREFSLRSRDNVALRDNRAESTIGHEVERNSEDPIVISVDDRVRRRNSRALTPVGGKVIEVGKATTIERDEAETQVERWDEAGNPFVTTRDCGDDPNQRLVGTLRNNCTPRRIRDA